ncbi:MAG: hypothetical protein PQJ46_14655, partial [Spirochaetales bacterium]|nr:hypothetical protein [Spirochaetales bacterium]
MHVDANSFYASCERLFRPDLYSKPIIVLSNNDGIVVALNAEAKKLGFSRGDVFYKIKDRAEAKGISVFSSNYTLYSDISARIVEIYGRLCAEVEIYSIDESFLYFKDYNAKSLKEIAHTIKNTVQREVGMPVSIGIAPTKTLSKFCNKLAKKRGGICCFSDLQLDDELSNLPVSDIWGIGRRKAVFLKRHSINTALDLKNYPLYKAKKYLSITGVRTVQELNGIPAISRIEREARDNIGSSKSFAVAVDNITELETALSNYTHEAVNRMRSDKRAANAVSVFLMTNPMSSVGEPFYDQMAATFPFPSSYLPEILGTAIELLRRIYKPGFRYRKVSVYLLGLEVDTVRQPDFFISEQNREKNKAVMECFDKINSKYGRETIFAGT